MRQKAMTDTEVRDHLIRAGVKNLREFGYPSVDATNILTDKVYRAFFVPMLRENVGQRGEVDRVIHQLISEIESQN